MLMSCSCQQLQGLLIRGGGDDVYNNLTVAVTAAWVRSLMWQLQRHCSMKRWAELDATWPHCWSIILLSTWPRANMHLGVHPHMGHDMRAASATASFLHLLVSTCVPPLLHMGHDINAIHSLLPGFTGSATQGGGGRGSPRTWT